MKTKYGEEIDPNDFPFAGQFGDYVRKNIDPEWGMEKKRELTKKRKYEISLNAVADGLTQIYEQAFSTKLTQNHQINK